jgi:site-specific DNA-adenine methylase
LEYSNNNLILLYNYLSKQTDDERKEICLIRLKERNKIKSELRESIRKIRNDKSLWAKSFYLFYFFRYGAGIILRKVLSQEYLKESL